MSSVIVNWNGREHLEVCLSSLLGQALAATEVVLVDNGSTDGSVALVHERFGEAVRVIALDSNRGYGGALNAGICAARGRYLFVLNNDTEVDQNCLRALVDTAERCPQAGLCAPKILSFSDRRLIDNVGLLLYPDGMSRGRGRLDVDRGQYDAEEEILLASGCAMLLRREMLADIGLFDEDLFAYCEDTDLGLRAQLAGWRCRYVPKAIVYHKYSASTAHYSPLKAFLVERNRLWVAVKCLPLPLLVMSLPFTALRLCVQALAVFQRRGAAGRFADAHSASGLLIVFIRAVLAALHGLPGAWRKRRTIQRRRRLSVWAPFGWLVHHGMGVREIALKD